MGYWSDLFQKIINVLLVSSDKCGVAPHAHYQTIIIINHVNMNKNMAL